jgi:hypothetical protein
MITMRDYHLLVATGIWIIVGATGAWYFEAPHIFERVGALICGTAAIFVVMQVIHEGRLDEERKTLENKTGGDRIAREVETFIPRSLLARVDNAIVHRGLDDIAARRMRFVTIVAITTFIGEIIHGFGEFIYDGGTDIIMYGSSMIEYIRTFLLTALR